MTQPADPHGPKARIPAAPIAAAARERVVELLTRHFANDEISEADLEDRLHRVYLATTGAELDALTADLPAPAPSEATPTVRAERIRPERIDAVFSGQERKVMGVVPRELRVRARAGYVELDLTRATFEAGLTTIDVRAFMGYVQIRLPAGVRVESNGRALFGFFSLKGTASGAEDATSVVRVTGRATFGFAECYIRSRGRRDDSS